MARHHAAPQSRRPPGETFDYLAIFSNAAGMGSGSVCCPATGSSPSRLGTQFRLVPFLGLPFNLRVRPAP